MIDLITGMDPSALWSFAALTTAGWMAVTIGWLMASRETLRAEEREVRFEVERRMVAALRIDEIKHEKLFRENVRLAVQARVLGSEPLAAQPPEIGNDAATGDDEAEVERSDDAFFVDMFEGRTSRSRHYSVKIEVDSPVARSARFRCLDKSSDPSSKRITLVIDELTSGTQLVATNCRELWHDDRWVFEARLPLLPNLDANDAPRVFKRRTSAWMKYFGPTDLPLTDRQRAFDELANWFLRLVEGREQVESGDLSRSVEDWENYMDPLPPYEGQRVYRRSSLEEPKIKDKDDEDDLS